jgi:hypothetical protein
MNLHGAGTPCGEVHGRDCLRRDHYYRERAGLAREKADAATVPETKKNYLAAEARWLALVRSHQLQDQLSRTLGASPPNKMKSPCYEFEPEVVAILSTAFLSVFAELPGRDDTVGLRAARRIIELAARGERDPERLKAVILGWLPEEVRL